MNNMFNNSHESLIYCIINEIPDSISTQLSSYVNNCSDACFLSSHKKLIDQRKCVVNFDYKNYYYICLKCTSKIFFKIKSNSTA